MSSSAAVIIQLISGTPGGNIAAFFFKKIFLGTVLNSIPGIIGGRLGGRFLGAPGVAAGGGGTDLSGIIGSILGGGVG